MQSNYFKGADPLSLDNIRSVLTRLEDTIIFGLIERAQFAHNPRIYQRAAFPELVALGFPGSWLDWFIIETESFHAKARRYTSPDEYPFTPPSNLPPPVLQSLTFPSLLHPNTVNANASILAFYTRSLVPRMTAREGVVEDDGNYGSAATLDIEVLQAISKRVHYGKFVSESKFRADPAAFVPHIRARNTDALAGLITKPEVERRLLLRLRKKASLYAQDFASDGEPLPGGKGKIDVDGVVDLYESYIIPLTKEVEVDYLLQRLDGLSTDEVDALAKPKAEAK